MSFVLLGMIPIPINYVCFWGYLYCTLFFICILNDDALIYLKEQYKDKNKQTLFLPPTSFDLIRFIFYNLYTFFFNNIFIKKFNS